MHPLMNAGGETFGPPAAVVEACKAAIAKGLKGDGALAPAVAAHLAAGEPIDLETAAKLHDCFTAPLRKDLAERGGQALKDACALMGGEAGLAWVQAVLAKDGGGASDAGAVEDAGKPMAGKFVEVLKVDEELGLVFGWAIVCEIGGKPYFDTQGDHIPEATMIKAAADFMASSRILGDMHQTAEGGAVVFAFPMTAEVAKSFGFTGDQSGLMIGVKPANPETLAKFKSGEYSGFSIGGVRITDEDVEE